MSKTDGIGTWVWNEKPAFSNGFSYSFEFMSNNTTYTDIAVDMNVGLNYLDFISAPILDNVYSFSPSSWVDEAYRTIDIKTAPPAEFLSILQANAVYQGGEEEPTKYQLIDQNDNLLEINGMSKGILTYQGKTYEWDNGGTPTDELLGTWVFNETLNDNPITANIVFTCLAPPNQTYNGITFNGSEMVYNKNQPITRASGGFPDPTVYYSGMGWSDGIEDYRTITITDTSTLTNRDEFTTWLKANAVKQ